MNVTIVDQTKIWPVVVGGTTVITVASSLLYVGIYDWQQYKSFLAGPASGWAGAIGSVGAVFCAIWIARRQRRWDEEQKERAADAAATWVIAIYEMQRLSAQQHLGKFDPKNSISELTYQRFKRAMTDWQPPEMQLLLQLELPIDAAQALIEQTVAYRYAMTLIHDATTPEMLGNLTPEMQRERAAAIHETLPKLVAVLDKAILIMRRIQVQRAEYARGVI